MNEKEFMELIRPAVADIDSGCPECIWAFVCRVNELLKRAGSPYRYGYGGLEVKKAEDYVKKIGSEDEGE